MTSNVIFFAWNRSIPGREETSAAHFQDFVQYLTEQQQGAIDSFEVVSLDYHGGDLNGFFLIHGKNDALDGLTSSDAWVRHVVRAGTHLDGLGVVRGVTGELQRERMNLWTDLLSET